METGIVSSASRASSTVAPKPGALRVTSRLPQVGTTIFSRMTELALEHNALNLAQGFPNFPCDARLKALATRAIERGFNQYAPMAGYMPLREEIARDCFQRYGVAYEPQNEVTVTTGATEGLFSAITALVHAGDEVVVFEPSYDSYLPAIELAGGVARFVSLEYPDYKIDWTRVRKLINSRTRAILLNTPHNPTGSILAAEDLEQLDQLTRDTNIVVLSDEVYEHMVYDGQTHYSPRLHPGLRERTMVFGSFGKSLHVTGWKVGYILAPEVLTTEFRKVHQYVTFATSTPLQVAIADYLTENPTYGDELGDFYQAKRDLFAQLMAQTRFKPLACSGSYFQLYSYADISTESELEFAQRLVREAGVAAIPVSVFYHQPAERQVLRFCFAKDDETLTRAAERLAQI